jgi:hypothetical protein
VQESALFWVVPWRQFLLLFIAAVAVIFALFARGHGRSAGLACVVFFLCSFSPSSASAAGDALSLTITPPMFQVNVSPGETWRSKLKVVNSNPYELVLYASVADFQADGEYGRGKFLMSSLSPDAHAYALAQWVDIASVPLVVAPQQSAEIPFEISLPPDAEPGGRYPARAADR